MYFKFYPPRLFLGGAAPPSIARQRSTELVYPPFPFLLSSFESRRVEVGEGFQRALKVA